MNKKGYVTDIAAHVCGKRNPVLYGGNIGGGTVPSLERPLAYRRTLSESKWRRIRRAGSSRVVRSAGCVSLEEPNVGNDMQTYLLGPVVARANPPKAFDNLQSITSDRCDVLVKGIGSIRFDFGVESALAGVRQSRFVRQRRDEHQRI